MAEILSIGDLEIVLSDDNRIVTVYEMKAKKVRQEDVEIALTKVSYCTERIDNFIFITTDLIDPDLEIYLKPLYDETGVEFVVLDCIGFTKHFLHLFHRDRSLFLNTYQELILSEPNSSISPPVKEAFLALRAAAEAK